MRRAILIVVYGVLCVIEFISHNLRERIAKELFPDKDKKGD